MAKTLGIDVSEYQSDIDWEKVSRAGKRFAILRMGYGRYQSQIDRRFEENYRAAKAAGIHVGAYLFSYAVTPDNAREEAENCLQLIRGKTFEYPIVYDIETASQRKLGREKLSEIVRVFCDTLEKNGYYAAIYANLDFLKNALTTEVTSRYDVWLAQWADQPTYTGAYGMWQYSANGNVDGIRGPVDLDAAYKDYPAIMRANGLNGFPSRTRAEPFSGMPLTLENEPLYTSSQAPYPTARRTGTVYLYSTEIQDGRVRVTNKSTNAERKPTFLFTAGWVDSSVLE